MYDSLKTALLAASTISMAEYAWATRPSGNHGTFQIDFEITPDNGNDLHQARALEGSVDLFTKGPQPLIYAEIESILTTYCEGAWSINSNALDTATGLLHREYVFEVEVV